jgi:hypothetical protein
MPIQPFNKSNLGCEKCGYVLTIWEAKIAKLFCRNLTDMQCPHCKHTGLRFIVF